jgi:hypothetical protein
MAKYKELDGDATKPQLLSPDEIVVIPHCCNNIGAWGAGFVLALNKAFGNGPYQEYKKMEKESPHGLQNRLGENCVCDINKEGNIYVVNMVAQDGIRGPNNPRPIKYWALLRCMQQVLTYIGVVSSVESALREARPVVIHCPKFGSDLAGGNWSTIKDLIIETWVDRGIDVVVYNYVK